MNRLIIKTMALMAGIIVSGCSQKEEACIPHVIDSGAARVEFIITSPDFESTDTKSSFVWKDDEIKDVEIFAVADDGTVEESIYVQGNAGMLGFNAAAGSSYTFFALANIGGKVSAKSMDELLAMKRSISFSDIDRKGMPFSNPEGVKYTVHAGDNTVRIPLKRMLARIDLSIDPSLLQHADADGFKIRSARLYNAISTYKPFDGEVRQQKDGEVDYDFDKASLGDIRALNSGEVVSMYAFENMQGDLLPSNKDPWNKVPENIDIAEYCSYVEVQASYSSKGLYCEDITYRFYLGDNSTSNFDVRRNTVYQLVLKPTEEELDGHRGSWKISSKDWDDRRSLRFNPDAIVVPSLGSAGARIEMAPEDFEIAIKEDGWLSSAGCSMRYDNETREMRITNISEIENDISEIISVISWDGALKDECMVTIKAPVRPVSIAFDETAKEIYVNGPNAGDNGRWEPVLTVTYSDGSKAHVKASISSSDASVAAIIDGHVVGVSKGSASITASYSEKGTTVKTQEAATVTVTDPLLSLSAEPEEISIDLYGEKSYSLRTNVRNGNVRITAHFPSGDRILTWEEIKWSFSNSTFYLGTGISDGKILTNRANNGSTASMSASYTYDGVTKAATIRLYAYTGTLTRLYITPEVATIEVGEDLKLTLYGVYSTGSERVIGSAAWSADNGCISHQSYGSGERLVTGVTGGTTTITAGYGGLRAYAVITVIQEDIITHELVVTPDEANGKVGDAIQFKAKHYTTVNGIRDNGTDVTNEATWQLTPAGGATVDAGLVEAGAAGTYTVRCSYMGESDEASVTFVMPDIITHELVLSKKSVTLVVGESSEVKAVWYTLTNGIRNGGEDVTDLVSWKSSDVNVATVSGAEISAIKHGKATVTATYSGEQASVDVTVMDVVEQFLTISPEEVSLLAGESAELKLTRFTITNGISDSGEDVTGDASWTSEDSTVASVSGGKVTGVSPGSTWISASIDGSTAKAAVIVTEPDPEIVAIKVIPELLKLEKHGQQRMAVKAVWSDGRSTDVRNEDCDWRITSGQEYFNLSDEGMVTCIAAGGNGKARVTLKDAPDLTADFIMECTTVLALIPSVTQLDTWGGNSYALSFTFDESTVLPELESIVYTKGAPEGLLSFTGGKLVAKDWWGMSGAWIDAGPEYIATFKYNGCTATVRGRMHGTTGFNGIEIHNAYFRDVKTIPQTGPAYLTGSDVVDVKDRLQLKVQYTDKDLSDGHLKVGSYNVDYSVVDPTNGLTRSGGGSFTIRTNVVSVNGTITIKDCQYNPNDNRMLNAGTTQDGGVISVIGIRTNGHDESLFKVEYRLKYTDVYGNVHTATWPLESPDYGAVPAMYSGGGVAPQEDTYDKYTINGFTFYIEWRADVY